jgi:hypothetical protein
MKRLLQPQHVPVNTRFALLISVIFALQACAASSSFGCPDEGLESEEHIQQLRRFMESHGADVSHLCVKKSSLGGRGLFPKKNISPSEPIFSVPEDVIMDQSNRIRETLQLS